MDTQTVTDDHRNSLGVQLTRRIGDLLAEGLVSLDEAGKIAEFILGKIDKATTHADLIEFLFQLNSKWPFFEPVLQFQQGTVKLEKDKQKVAQMETLIREKQVDAAIATAKTD